MPPTNCFSASIVRDGSSCSHGPQNIQVPNLDRIPFQRRRELKKLPQLAHSNIRQLKGGWTGGLRTWKNDRISARAFSLKDPSQTVKQRSTVTQKRKPTSALALMRAGRRARGLSLQNCSVGFLRPSVNTNRSTSPVHTRSTSIKSVKSKSSTNSIMKNARQPYAAWTPSQTQSTVRVARPAAGLRCDSNQAEARRLGALAMPYSIKYANKILGVA
jgi:hypothetical protein